MNNQGFIVSLTFYDKVLIFCILTIAIVLYGIFALITFNSSDDIVVIRQDGIVIFQLTQEQMRKDGVYDFRFDGGSGQIEVKEKKVRMLPMDKTICPEAICSKTGWIDSYLKTIVCLPNRLIVSFINNNNDEIDGIVY